MNKLKISTLSLLISSLFTSGAYAAVGTQDSSDQDLSIVGAYDVGIYANQKSLNFSGENINIDITPGNSWGSGQVGVYSLKTGANVSLGSDNTENISINIVDDSGVNDIAIGLWATQGGNISVNAKQLRITGHSTGGWIYALSSQGNSQPANSVVINADTYINVTSDIKGQAEGVVAMSSGFLTINGNLEVHADDVIVTRGGATTRINESGEHTVKLFGNINFSYDEISSGTPIDADLLVYLKGEDSCWEGNLLTGWRKKEGSNLTDEDYAQKLNLTQFKLVLEDNASWTPSLVEESDVGTTGTTALNVSNLSFNNGIINIAEGTDQVVQVENLSGTGGTINTVATTDGTTVSAGQLRAASVEGTPHFTVNALGINSDDITNQQEALESLYASALALGDSSEATATLNIAEGTVAGALTAEASSDGVAVSEAKNSVNRALIDIASSNYLFFRSQINDVSARMGDLRSMPKTAGAWIRYYGGKNKYSDRGMKEKYNTLQIGGDAFVSDNIYLGGTFSYTDGDGTLKNGSTDDKNYSFGIYGGWIGEKGQFVDVIIKRHRVETDFDLYSVNGLSSGSYHNWGTSASVEAGWRLQCPSTGFYAEPQAELQFGRLDSVNYKTNKGVKVEQDGIDSVIGRAGLAVGYTFPENKGTAYAKASVLHDWKGEVKSTFSANGVNRTYKDDLGGTWGEFAVGATYNPTKNISAYGQVKTSAGSPVRNPWQVSVGLRYSF